jgi:arabinose-5-phosphate isomerase
MTFDRTRALRLAQETFDIEAAAVLGLKARTGDAFAEAVAAMLELRGRVVVMGMGKSGHVGRKIAATLASTGTAAMFVHPAEASHGDLGMIKPVDLVLAISNGGESEEITVILPVLKRLGVPMVAMTGNLNSTLGRHADVVLDSGVEKEACPLNLAPTASTTAQLALGDALAVALLERKGFSTEDFRALHPGGKLGQKLLRVADLMHVGKELPLISVESGMQEAILEMTAKTYGCVGAIDADGRLAGIVTDGDLRRHMNVDLMHRTVREVMTAHPRTIRPGALAAEALHVMNEKSITSLFVLEDGKPVGIVRLHDCLKAGVA